MTDGPPPGRSVVGGPGPPQRARRPPRSLLGVVGLLTGANSVVVLTALVTAPLLARALGAEGRGLLAAIMVPLGFLPTLAGLGLGAFAARETARGGPAGTVIGSLVPAAFALAIPIMLLAPWIAEFFGQGEETVEFLLLIGILLLPLTLLAYFLLDIARGLERWGIAVVSGVLPLVTYALGTVALFVAGELSVESATILSFVTGSLALAPLASILHRAWPLRFDIAMLRRGVSFGARGWLGSISQLMNVRLDQLVMIRLVSPSELGLYVVGTTLARFFVGPVVHAVMVGSTPRLARGEAGLAQRLVRTTMLGIAAAGAVIGVSSPLVLRFVFGREFTDALPITLILLAAAIPMAGSMILSTAITNRGYPGGAALGEGLSLAVTIPGLFLLLPSLGGIGAALVSLAAYTLTMVYLLVLGRRVLGGGFGDFLIPRATDAARLVSIVRVRRRESRAVV